uniref:Chromatin assembly factor 1 subunit B n=1 Tax=Panagrolaimus superbus TaxID=310955 RepID=A0A914YZU8_9BILA
MKTYTPVIYWFDKSTPITAIDIQQVDVPAKKTREVERNCERYYKLATVGVQELVRIWEYCFDKEIQTVHVDFIAQLEGHNKSINCCKFSPNGEMLASGDSDGVLFIWQYSDEEIHVDPTIDLDFPPNKENWKHNRKVNVRHSGDINCIAWSPDSRYIATGSADNTVAVHDVTNGHRLWDIRNFRNFPVGLSWDPHGKYIISCSTDRRLDVIDAQRGHRKREFFTVTGLKTVIGDVSTNPEVPYKLFHDSQLVSFTRATDFSPCGSLLFVPAAHLEVSDSNIYGTYVIRRSDFESLRPYALLPSSKPTVFVRCSPIVYELLENKENFLGLPYRVVFGVLTKESITIYDTQHSSPIIYIDTLHYQDISGFSWAPDGKNIIISSWEGFNTFISDFEHEFGKRTQIPEMSDELINVLKKTKKETKEEKSAKKPKEEKSAKKRREPRRSEKNSKEIVKDEPEKSTPKVSKAETTPSKKGKTETPTATPKTPSIVNFLTPKSTQKPKIQKRIETVMIE